MVHRMDARSDAGIGRCVQRQGRHQTGVVFFESDGRAIFTVERDIKNAGAELFRHFGLQLKALAHARFHAAAMVADRQKASLRLGAQQHIARMRWWDRL
ncbi:hypothetical protein D3C86_1928480 [compost metagenome]